MQSTRHIVESCSTPESQLRGAVVGLSANQISGVRDHATLLAAALQRHGVPCEWHWLMRSDTSLRGARSEIRKWARGLAGELRRSRPGVIVWHYSVFDYAHRGVPLYVAPMLSALRATRTPVIAVLHEMAYPWWRSGWRGAVWGPTQRLALIEVMRSVSAAVVTADFRADWLGSRRWVARRPLAVAPVFSNLPPPSARAGCGVDAGSVGVFGYAYQNVSTAFVLDAMRLLAEGGRQVSLRLLGAPGRASPAGEQWLREARVRGLAGALSFTGPLPAQQLSDALAACEVLLFPDAAGPSSRKGSLAAALASARPVVALDGPYTWSALNDRGALLLVSAQARALGDAIASLLGDRDAAERLGARGRAFYEQEMRVDVTAAAVVRLLDQLGVGRSAHADAPKS